MNFNDVSIHRLLFLMSRDASLRALADAAVATLRRYDEKYTSDLLGTCRAYIQMGC